MQNHATILVVENGDLLRPLLSKILIREGYKVLEAKDGAEALHLWDRYSGTIDVVVTDVVMPNMSGHEALKIIRDKERERGVSSSQEVKVVMTSALDDVKSVTQSFFQGGASAYLVKPIDRDKIIEELHKLGLV